MCNSSVVILTTAGLTWVGIALFPRGSQKALAYPPAVGILGKAKNCLVCHINNGPWKDNEKTISDVLDKETQKSLKQADGSFLIEAKRGETKTMLTVIGRTGERERKRRDDSQLF